MTFKDLLRAGESGKQRRALEVSTQSKKSEAKLQKIMKMEVYLKKEEEKSRNDAFVLFVVEYLIGGSIKDLNPSGMVEFLKEEFEKEKLDKQHN